jgi:hypothetical protein
MLKAYNGEHEASHEDVEPTFQFKVTDLCWAMNLGLNSKKVFCLTSVKCLPDDKHPNLRKAAICESSLSTYIWEQINLKKQNQPTDKNLVSIHHLQQASHITWNAWQVQCGLNNHIGTLRSDHLTNILPFLYIGFFIVTIHYLK